MEYILYGVVVAFGVGIFLNLVAISLPIGIFGGIVVGFLYGIRNYFSSLMEEIRLRK